MKRARGSSISRCVKQHRCLCSGTFISIAIVLAGGGGVLLSLNGAASAAVRTSVLAAPANLASLPTICSTPIDPYSVAMSVLQECDVPVYPLQSTVALGGGGTLYTYVVAGNNVTFAVPPAGFDPSTASSKQLAEYQLPARPASGADLARWETQVANAQIQTPPPYLVTDPYVNFGNVQSSNWAGYVDTASSNAYYSAYMDYNEPIVYSSGCSNDVEGTWTGLGGFNTSNLSQAGSAYNDPLVGNHQMWWELLPANPVPINLYTSGGLTTVASTTWTGSGFSYYFYAAGKR
jgi:hypothetical protein